MRARLLSRSLLKAVVDTNVTAAHCSETIAARLPIFAGCLVAPSGAALAEWNMACAEKVAAVMEGAVAASAEWQAAMMRSAFRGATPTGLAHYMLRVMNKAAHPARRRAKANAKRLGRARSRT
jgi:hypothetical protein